MLVAHSQLEESTPQVGAILHHEVDYHKQFCFWRTVFHLSVAQHLTAIFNATENCTPIPFLFLQLCSGEASVSRTYTTFYVGIPELSLRTAPALCSGRLSVPFHSIRTSSLCCASGAVSGSLCLRIFYESSMKYSQILDAHQLRVHLGAFHVNTASTATAYGLMPCYCTIFPRTSLSP